MARTYIQIEMFKVECPRCGGVSYIMPPQFEHEMADIKCGFCPWYPYYHYFGNPNWEEDNIRDFQLEQI